MEIVLRYDAAVFDLVALCAFTNVKERDIEAIAATGVTITQIGAREIRLKVDRTAPADKLWAGTLNTTHQKTKVTTNSGVQVGQYGDIL